MAGFKPKILLVDDEAEARSALARTLKGKGYSVVELDAGAEVLAKAKSEWPALIILDIVLPDVPGTEVIQQLRADPITQSIPVLLLTAKPDVVSQAGVSIPQFRSSSDRYFEKPGRIDALLTTIQEMLTGRK